ncbi:MAG: CoA-binding protein [Dehalococcoidia bacterium]|nr:CoA-binding protein [Dehalococcoidia bacterium]MDD5493679.1 CoA-binding protein [Dehalococcoidia bacterium]
MNIKTASNLDEIFFPRNVAIIGATTQVAYPLALLGGKMRDHTFMVNPNYKEVLGKKAYASIMDIEEPVDYVILTLPARYAAQAARECVQKGVKVIHSFTSGFSETGLKEGIEREKELISILKGKVRLIGPNCMGVYCPKSGLSFNPASTHEEGHIGVISQSGTFAQFFIHAGHPRNVKISKIVSYGNAADLDCPDFLEYMADDPDTRVIALYIEGITNGKRLQSALEYAAGKKPVIALKGGVTDQGGRVASSHTGALAGTGETWATMFKQAGVVQVEDFDDLLNAAVALNESPLPAGKGVSIITYSGGFSVVQTDMCIKAGLEVPKFSAKAVEELRKFVPVSGTMVGNPLDAWQLFYKYDDKGGTLKDIFRIIAGEKDVHSIILQFDVIRFMLNMWSDTFEEYFEAVVQKVLQGCHYAHESGKVVFVSMFLDPFAENEIERKYNLIFKKRLENEGFPVYPTLNDAVRTVGSLYKFTEMRQRKVLKTG